MSAGALAQAVHAVLRDDVHIQDTLGDPPRLYDEVPEGPEFPYLTYGAIRTTDIGADDTPLFAYQMTLHLWSRYEGRAEVLALITRVSSALTAERLSAAGDLSIARASLIFSDILHAPDGLSRHGVLRMSFITEGDAS